MLVHNVIHIGCIVRDLTIIRNFNISNHINSHNLLLLHSLIYPRLHLITR